MKVKAGNKTTPTINNQESDKVIIDGLMTPEDIMAYGQLSSEATLEKMRQLYPKNSENELKELALMEDEAFTKELSKLTEYSKENIEAFYQNQLLKDKIQKTRNRLGEIYKEYQKTKENNLIYQKDEEIKKLKEELEKYNKKDKS